MFLIGAVLVLACVGLVLYNSQQSGRYDDLTAQLTTAKEKLNKINNNDLLAQKTRLEQEIAVAQGKQQEISNSLQATNDSISCTDVIIDEASKYSLYITSMNSSSVAPGVLKETVCTAQTVQLTVRGTRDSLASFVTSLSKTFPTGVIETFQMVTDEKKSTVPKTPELDASENPDTDSQTVTEVDDGKDTTANISLVIYSYKGE